MPIVKFNIALDNPQNFAPGTEAPTQLRVTLSKDGAPLGDQFVVIDGRNPVPVDFEVAESGWVRLGVTAYSTAGQVGELTETDVHVQLVSIGLPSGVTV